MIFRLMLIMYIHRSRKHKTRKKQKKKNKMNYKRVGVSRELEGRMCKDVEKAEKRGNIVTR